MTKRKKILKPIDADVHFKYRCPKCSIEHWISLREAQTKNFKIVCDCSKVFSPKRVSKIKIKYHKTHNRKSSITEKQAAPNTIQPIPQNQIITEINNDLLDKCSNALMAYGFTKAEAKDLIKQTYYTNPSDDAGLLIKLALKSFGESQI